MTRTDSDKLTTARAAALRRALTPFKVADRAAARAVERIVATAGRDLAGERGITVTINGDDLVALATLLTAGDALAFRADELVERFDVVELARADVAHADAVARRKAAGFRGCAPGDHTFDRTDGDGNPVCSVCGQVDDADVAVGGA